jgi:hypothetical protein
MAAAQPPQNGPTGAEIDGIFESSDMKKINGAIDANRTVEKADTTSTTDSTQFPDEETGPTDEFQVPREPDRPERRFREFKGRHIQMMALGISSHLHN